MELRPAIHGFYYHEGLIMTRYPKAFTKYWDDVELCGIMEYDDFKHEAYLAWKNGKKQPRPTPKAPTVGEWLGS